MTDHGGHERPSSTGGLGAASFVLGFLPWIVFAVVSQRLAANGVAWAGVLGTVIAAVSLLSGLGKDRPRTLDVVSMVLFGLVAVIGAAGGPAVDAWLFAWGRSLVGVALGAFVLLSAPFAPFTAAYAHRSVPREYWRSSTFLRINRVLSAVWGIALLVMGSASLAVTAVDAQATDTSGDHLLDLLLNWAVPVAAVWVALRITATYPDRVSGSSSPAAQTTTPTRVTLGRPMRTGRQS